MIVLPRLILPAVGWRLPATRMSSVDFPAPLMPRMPVRSPGAIRHVTSFSTSFVVPVVLSGYDT